MDSQQCFQASVLIKHTCFTLIVLIGEQNLPKSSLLQLYASTQDCFWGMKAGQDTGSRKFCAS